MQEYINTDRQLHWLSQEITKVIRAYLPPKDDDSHTNLAFDALGNRITGQWVSTQHGILLFVLELSPLQFVWVNRNQEVLKTIPLIGKNIREVRSEIAESLSGFGLDTEPYEKKLHYEIPEYGFEDKPVLPIPETGIRLWADFRALANTACMQVSEYFQTPSPIRIWPHHFDTGIYIVPNEKTGIGFGLAMEDAMAGAPYFYIAGYPAQGKLHYNNLPHLQHGKWIVGENWSGGILTLEELLPVSYDQREDILKIFLQQTLAWYLAQ
ncbi:MAG: hypothetical protein K0B37_17480 [Bacteroidales bacterium]|nr:hypothetical protein [Bacteroidales bacterium]